MNMTLSFARLLFLVICIIFSVNFSTQYFEDGFSSTNILVGILGGIGCTGMLCSIEFLLQKFNLKAFNAATLGLFFGYLLSQAVFLILGSMVGEPETLAMPVKFFITLLAVYLGLTFTVKASEEFYISLPFIQFKSVAQKKKDILVDISILMDSRIIDLAACGLLDHHLIIPRFAIKELYTQAETSDESNKAKARKSLEVIKKLESLPTLDLRYVDTDFPEIKDSMTKLVKLARFLDTNIITSDFNRIQQSTIEGIRIINIHSLSNALKPLTQTGEFINIKIQRYGKEPRQGVGYLEDGTMVVVNGGAEFIGETIKSQVLSVKHTSSGRMIFCNACEEGSLLGEQDFSHGMVDMDVSSKNYLTL